MIEVVLIVSEASVDSMMFVKLRCYRVYSEAIKLEVLTVVVKR